MTALSTLELRIEGMDCTQCAMHVCDAIEAVAGVSHADVRLTAGKAIVELDSDRVSVDHIRAAVAVAGYTVPVREGEPGDAVLERDASALAKRAALLTGMVFGAVLLVVVAGEWLGLLARATDTVPFGVGIGIVLVIGWPPFAKVIRATLQRRIVSHTLMSVGVVAALVIGQWVTAAVVAFFMRVGDLVERFTVQRGGQAVRDLASLAPSTARVVKGLEDVEVPIEEIQPGDHVRVRPGEKIPADGTVVSGTAYVDQAAVTGESLPASKGPGSAVYAAALVSGGALRIRVERVGADATFGRILHLIEQAESNRSRVQLMADRFSAQYLPVVALVALLTFLIRRDPLATTAVLVVACSCAFALATPVAMLASIGTAARSGLLVKGGKYLELLARADVLLLDKTGTLTMGRPRVVEITALDGRSEDEILRLAGSVERFSEHPLAEAAVSACRERKLELEEPSDFEAWPGLGVAATLTSGRVSVGNAAFAGRAAAGPRVAPSEVDGATEIHVSLNATVMGIIHVTDTLRPEVPAALLELQGLGLTDIEILTGDGEAAASAIAGQLGVRYRAELLPEDKIEIVREHQRRGHTVVMVGDGVNDAPALAQADVGIAMGAAGTDLALEVSDVALLRDDWSLLPEAFRIARRSMGVVRMNLAFTGLYNLVGLTLAALGILPPILAAAAQSIPDLGIMGNSARLLRRQ